MTQFQPQLGNAFYKALGAEDMEPLLAINEIIAKPKPIPPKIPDLPIFL